MKKKLALMMTLVMAMSLAACGGSGSSAAGTTAADTEAATTEAAVTEIAAEDTTAAAEETTGEAEETAGEAAADSDKAYVQGKGTLVVGITDFEPMDYKDANGEWIGFDADLAKAFAENLGVTVEFVEIDWDNKILELDSQAIDCVWNGMTLTDEVTSAMECSNAYCNNSQVVIVKADVADQYQTVESLSELNFAVEAGSAGETVANALGLNNTPVKDQASALMEVSAGSCDAAVIDALMAGAMVGEGTGYADLTYTISLNEDEGEVYGVGFRKGSDLTLELNAFLASSYADGSMEALAETYGVQASIIPQLAR